MSVESPSREFPESLNGKKPAVVVLFGIVLLLAAACGGQASDDSSNGSGKREASGSSEQGTTSAASSEKGVVEETTVGKAGPSGEAAELARAEVEKGDLQHDAGGREKAGRATTFARDPPERIEVYPATTNHTVEGPIEYDREPPTNGDHDPLWQNAASTRSPSRQARRPQHGPRRGLDHLPPRPAGTADRACAPTVRGLRHSQPLSRPGRARNRHLMEGPARTERRGRPAPEQFVNEFKVSELAPLSGNRCTLGVGNPKGNPEPRRSPKR